MQKSKISTKQIVIAAMLTALALIIPMVSPKLPLPQPFSVTFAAHVPTLIAIFISPWVAVCTVIGSTLGFFITLGPVVAIRAASHIFFVLFAVFALKAKWNGYLVLIISAIIHGIGEALVVLWFAPLFGMPVVPATFTSPIIPFLNSSFGATADYLVSIVFGITIFHHSVDSVVAIILMYALNKSKVFKINLSSLGFNNSK